MGSNKRKRRSRSHSEEKKERKRYKSGSRKRRSVDRDRNPVSRSRSHSRSLSSSSKSSYHDIDKRLKLIEQLVAERARSPCDSTHSEKFCLNRASTSKESHSSYQVRSPRGSASYHHHNNRGASSPRDKERSGYGVGSPRGSTPRDSASNISEVRSPVNRDHSSQNSYSDGEGDNTPLVTNNDVLIIDEDEKLEAEILKYLGEDPSTKKTTGLKLHLALTQRWTHILKNGVEKSDKEELLQKYITPENFTILKAPTLNTEIIPIIPPLTQKKDRYMSAHQNQLSIGITALGTALNALLRDKENFGGKQNLLTPLSDSARILLDLHHSMSQTRRGQILPIFSKQIKEAASEAPIDDLLFGNDFGERCKNIKALEKCSKELKDSAASSNTSVITFKKPKIPFTSGKHLNRRGLPYPTREMRHKGQRVPRPRQRKEDSYHKHRR